MKLRNPCGPDADKPLKDARVLRTVPGFQPSWLFDPGVAANPLVAQNWTYTRYEVRINEPEYSALAFSGWSQGGYPAGPNLTREAPARRFNFGQGGMAPSYLSGLASGSPGRYYVVENAEIVDVGKTLAAGRMRLFEK